MKKYKITLLIATILSGILSVISTATSYIWFLLEYSYDTLADASDIAIGSVIANIAASSILLTVILVIWTVVLFKRELKKFSAIRFAIAFVAVFLVCGSIGAVTSVNGFNSASHERYLSSESDYYFSQVKDYLPYYDSPEKRENRGFEIIKDTSKEYTYNYIFDGGKIQNGELIYCATYFKSNNPLLVYLHRMDKDPGYYDEVKNDWIKLKGTKGELDGTTYYLFTHDDTCNVTIKGISYHYTACFTFSEPHSDYNDFINIAVEQFRLLSSEK
ncbi:MAG: hypothetical protein NC122_04420 [Faecalibacterium sp.]|nr:hypothetical protein [Ruminococcus sp.]MCM1391782.1 hypothetical protein [Ruminococcus sp.]MCM1485428.1 hypothetical protein [Faecalibacterium sp.]